MASGITSTAESKSAKKKKGKMEAGAAKASKVTSNGAPPASDSVEAAASAEAPNGTGDGQEESQYLKELSRNIRNIAKKIAAATKTESIVHENSGQTLDDLVASKKINADQKAQLQKKPSLEAEKARLEDQIVHYRKFGKDYEERFAKDKAALEESHAQAVARARLEAADEATITARKQADQQLLVISQFLHAAAAKRQAEDLDPSEKAAFEGVLLLVYQGNKAALTAINDVAAGSDKRVSNTEGEEIDFTYAKIKQIAMRDAPILSTEESVEGHPEDPSEPMNGNSDPTVAHAGLTEMTQGSPPAGSGGTATPRASLMQPEQSSIPLGAANAAAEQSWDPQASMLSDTPSREEWVEVPRNPDETETGVQATPAAMHGSNSWAEEVNADAAAKGTNEAGPENDGFEQVVHHHHQPRGRGRGPRGDFRGRGYRGGPDSRGYRGRGDGGRYFRGDGDRRGSGGRGRGRGGGDGWGYRGGGGGGRGRDGGGETGPIASSW